MIAYKTKTHPTENAVEDSSDATNLGVGKNRPATRGGNASAFSYVKFDNIVVCHTSNNATQGEVEKY